MALTALAFSGGKDSMACLHLMRETLDCAIFVDTGFTYPETREMVNYAASLVPTMHVVQTDRRQQNAREGIPADIVPIAWTVIGQQFSGNKAVTIQSYLGCCWETIIDPLWAKARELGVTHIVMGQRTDEPYKSPARHETPVDGIVRLHPIEDWSGQQVLAYLKTKMDVPAHYLALEHNTSLDCYDCPAYEHQSRDRLVWTAARYPAFYAEYSVRRKALDGALREALLGGEAAP